MIRGVDRAVKATYGVDAPGFLPFALFALLFTVTASVASGRPAPLVGAALLLACLGFFFHTTRRGKLLVWRELIDNLSLHGSERILDLGCGRGAVLLTAAKRVTAGHAFGVDIWSRTDQSGNSAQAALENSRIEGLGSRVSLTTADMTALPFPAETFDLVVSNVAIHNIKGRPRRRSAVDEAVRVLRPGGRLLIADLRDTNAYVTRLEALGMVDVSRRNLGWRMWWGGPWGSTRLVTATKAA